MASIGTSDREAAHGRRRGANTQERWARLRFAVVGPLLASPPPPGRLGAELRRLSQREWEHPTRGGPVRFSVSTVERWYYQARSARNDPVGALKRRPRADAGRERSISALLMEALREQYRAHPSWSAQLHHENLAARVEADPALGPMPSYATLTRAMRNRGLVRKRRRRRSGDRDKAPVSAREVLSYEVSRSLQSVDVSPSGVRGVWLRHELATRHQRLLRLETQAQDDTLALSDEQIRLLERHSCEFRMRHVEVSAPGELLNQDTFYWGTLKGVGKIYVQVVVDAFCSLAFAKVYTSKMPITAAELLYDRVLPFYEALGVPVQAVLTDNGREYCGRPERHPYELLLALHDIEHRRTKIRSPRTNGFVERMNRTLLDECFRIKGRTTWYISPEEIQRDLDQYLSFYNLKRSHQGYRLKGRTPAQALREALGRKRLPPIVPKENLEVVKEAA